MATASLWRLHLFGSKAWSQMNGQNEVITSYINGKSNIKKFSKANIERLELESFAQSIVSNHKYPVSYDEILNGVATFEAITNSIKKNGKKSKDEKSELNAKEKFVLSISENGFGKKTSHFDYRVTNRGGKGIIGIVNSPRNGNITSSFPVNEGDEILISTNKGRVIRVAVKEIRTAGRNTQGVRIIKLSGEEKVVSAIKIDDNLI